MKATLEASTDPSTLSQPYEKSVARAVEPQDTQISAVQVVLYAIVIALSLGLSQSAYVAIRRYVLFYFVGSNESIYWLTPVTHLTTFLVLAAVLLSLVRICRGNCNLSVATIWFVFFAAFEVTSIVPHLHSGARALLAIGVAVQASRVIRRRGQSICERLPTLALGLSMCVLVLLLGIEGTGIVKEHQAMKGLPVLDIKDAPNVLLIVLDTVRSDAVDFGHDNATGFPQAETPFLRQLASEGVCFDHAISTAPWTLPAHASLFTGKRPDELTTSWTEPLDDRFTTLAEVLRARGYATGGFVANCRFCGSETGIDQGYIRYRDYSHSFKQFLNSTNLTSHFGGFLKRFQSDKLDRKRAPTVTREFLTWLDDQVIPDQRRPFFAFLNYLDAHHPYLADEQAPHRPRNADEMQMFLQWWHVTKTQLSTDQVAYSREAYLDCIRYLDQHLSKLKSELRRRGVWDNTLVIVTADHGEHFGEHDLFLHGNSLYEPLINVPLAIRFPGVVPAGLRIADTVSLVDVPATVIDLIQTTTVDSDSRVGDASGTSFPGRTLADFWESRNVSPRRVYSRIAKPAFFPPCHGHSPIFRGEMESLSVSGLKYIRAGDDEELYDVKGDPSERVNVVDNPAFADELEKMRDELNRLQIKD